jgi:hypothetical protein
MNVVITVANFEDRTLDTYSVYADSEEQALYEVISHRGGNIPPNLMLSEMLGEFENDDVSVTILTFDLDVSNEIMIVNPAHGKLDEIDAM